MALESHFFFVFIQLIGMNLKYYENDAVAAPTTTTRFGAREKSCYGQIFMQYSYILFVYGY